MFDQNYNICRERLVQKLETVTQRGHFRQMAKLYDILGNDSSFPFSIRLVVKTPFLCMCINTIFESF